MAASEAKSGTMRVGGHETKRAGDDVEEARRSPPAGGEGPTSENKSASEKTPTGEKDPPTDDAVTDPNLVDWDGPNDPANPRNWSKARKMLNIALVSLSVLYSYVRTNSIPICSNSTHYTMGKNQVLTQAPM